MFELFKLQTLLLMAMVRLQLRVKLGVKTDQLHRPHHRERGAGGNTLEILLLAVGGVIVAALVVVAVKTAVDNKTGELVQSPGGKD